MLVRARAHDDSCAARTVNLAQRRVGRIEDTFASAIQRDADVVEQLLIEDAAGIALIEPAQLVHSESRRPFGLSSFGIELHETNVSRGTSHR